MSDELDPRWIGAVVQADHWHFLSTLYARYGIVLAPGEFGSIMRSLKEGTAQLIEQRKGRQAIYSVRIKSAKERVYLLVERGRLVTAWPPERRLNEIRRALRD